MNSLGRDIDEGRVRIGLTARPTPSRPGLQSTYKM
jgi:hypothetical protein